MLSLAIFSDHARATSLEYDSGEEVVEDDITKKEAPLINKPQILGEELGTSNAITVTPPPEKRPGFYNRGKFQLLNKITARISTINIMENTSSKIGNLEIIMRSCWKAPADQMPENKAFIEITEQKQIFAGWIFSSSPSISGLEHPVYDVTLLECVE